MTLDGGLIGCAGLKLRGRRSVQEGAKEAAPIGERAGVAGVERVGSIPLNAKGSDNIVRIKCGAVVEDHARAQLEGPLGQVSADFVGFSEGRLNRCSHALSCLTSMPAVFATSTPIKHFLISPIQ